MEEASFKALINKKYFLFIGRDHVNKGLDEFVNLSNYFNDDINFVIVSKTKRNISDDRFNIFEGLSDISLQVLIKNAEAVIIPSKYEAFSLVGLDSIMLGTPIICSENVMLKSFFTKPMLNVVNFPIDLEEIYNVGVNILNCESEFKISKMLFDEFKWSNVSNKTLAVIDEIY